MAERVWKATVELRVRGRQSAWQASRRDEAADGQLTRTSLEIQGSSKQGFHLVVEPEGFFAADTWHETEQDARSEAEEAFGVLPGDWSAC